MVLVIPHRILTAQGQPRLGIVGSMDPMQLAQKTVASVKPIIIAKRVQRTLPVGGMLRRTFVLPGINTALVTTPRTLPVLGRPRTSMVGSLEKMPLAPKTT